MRWSLKALNRFGTIKEEKTKKHIANILKRHEINYNIDYLMFIFTSIFFYKSDRNSNDQLLYWMKNKSNKTADANT